MLSIIIELQRVCTFFFRLYSFLKFMYMAPRSYLQMNYERGSTLRIILQLPCSEILKTVHFSFFIYYLNITIFHNRQIEQESPKHIKNATLNRTQAIYYFGTGKQALLTRKPHITTPRRP